MVVRITGVVQNGTERAIGVPADPRRPIRALVDDGVTVELTVVYPSGQPVDLSVGPATVTMRIGRKSTFGVGKLIEQAGSLVGGGTEGRADITVAPASLEEARALLGLVYEIFITQGGVRSTVVPLSAFALDPTVGD